MQSEGKCHDVSISAQKKRVESRMRWCYLTRRVKSNSGKLSRKLFIMKPLLRRRRAAFLKLEYHHHKSWREKAKLLAKLAKL